MTLQEKIGQLRCTLAWGYYDVIGRKKVVPSEAFKKDIADGNIEEAVREIRLLKALNGNVRGLIQLASYFARNGIELNAV